MIVREAAVAGHFYPGDPGALGTAVDGYLAGACAKHAAPKALVVPHAGYI
ncbi:MAG: AmmeMemoRadiSam system protein B, partial [Alphaproteobacteria bacterium]